MLSNFFIIVEFELDRSVKIVMRKYANMNNYLHSKTTCNQYIILFNNYIRKTSIFDLVPIEKKKYKYFFFDEINYFIRKEKFKFF